MTSRTAILRNDEISVNFIFCTSLPSKNLPSFSMSRSTLVRLRKVPCLDIFLRRRKRRATHPRSTPQSIITNAITRRNAAGNTSTPLTSRQRSNARFCQHPNLIREFENTKRALDEGPLFFFCCVAWRASLTSTSSRATRTARAVCSAFQRF